MRELLRAIHREKVVEMFFGHPWGAPLRERKARIIERIQNCRLGRLERCRERPERQTYRSEDSIRCSHCTRNRATEGSDVSFEMPYRGAIWEPHYTFGSR